MNKIKLTLIFLLLFFSKLFAQQPPAESLVQYVKPIIGTQRMGHTYPRPTLPFLA